MASAFDSSPETAARISAILQAAESYDVKQSSAWRELQSLSKGVQLDDKEIDPEGIVLMDNRFKGAMNLYVLLPFGTGSAKVETTESFAGRFEGHFLDGGAAQIDDLTVNTSSFFA